MYVYTVEYSWQAEPKSITLIWGDWRLEPGERIERAREKVVRVVLSPTKTKRLRRGKEEDRRTS
jgi:hypothetical protein